MGRAPSTTIAKVLALSLASACVYLTFLAVSGQWDALQYGTPMRKSLYNTPLGVALVLWLLDARTSGATRSAWAIAVVAVALAAVRDFVLIPLYSGHALLATFCAATARTWWARGVAGVVVVEVVALKIAWGDATWIGGAIGGAALAVGHRIAVRRATAA